MSDQWPDSPFRVDDRFQRAEWFAQRLGWALWVAIVVAGCLGVLGPGWLSDRAVTDTREAFTLNYERYVHHHDPSQLEIAFANPPDAAGEWTVHLGQSLLDGIQILRIEPEPLRQKIRADGASYTFAAAEGAASGRAVFHVEYEHFGQLTGLIGLDDGSPVQFNQYVYP